VTAIGIQAAIKTKAPLFIFFHLNIPFLREFILVLRNIGYKKTKYNFEVKDVKKRP